MPTACRALARIAERIGADTTGPRPFLVRFGREAAGVGSGPRAVLDLLRAGRTEVRGGGFRPELTDHSGSQARHFAGTARAVTVLGARPTLWIGAHVRRDDEDTADGRLSALAVAFATALLDGSLTTGDSGQWIREHLCAAPVDPRSGGG